MKCFTIHSCSAEIGKSWILTKGDTGIGRSMTQFGILRISEKLEKIGLFSYQLDFIWQGHPKMKRSPVYGGAMILYAVLVTNTVFKRGWEINESMALGSGAGGGQLGDLLKRGSQETVFCPTCSASRAHQIGPQMMPSVGSDQLNTSSVSTRELCEWMQLKDKVC